MTSIGIGIGIGNTGPVFTRYRIDTKICSIAHPYLHLSHPYLHFLKLLTHNYWRTLLSPHWTRVCGKRAVDQTTVSQGGGTQNTFHLKMLLL